MLTDATVTLIGYIGAEPSVATVSGRSVTRFSVAVNRKTGDEGSTLWFPIELWGAKPDMIARFRPGAFVRVTGSLFRDPKAPEGSLGLTVRYPSVLVLAPPDYAGRRDEAKPKGRGRAKATPVESEDLF